MDRISGRALAATVVSGGSAAVGGAAVGGAVCGRRRGPGGRAHRERDGLRVGRGVHSFPPVRWRAHLVVKSSNTQ